MHQCITDNGRMYRRIGARTMAQVRDDHEIEPHHAAQVSRHMVLVVKCIGSRQYHHVLSRLRASSRRIIGPPGHSAHNARVRRRVVVRPLVRHRFSPCEMHTYRGTESILRAAGTGLQMLPADNELRAATGNVRTSKQCNAHTDSLSVLDQPVVTSNPKDYNGVLDPVRSFVWLQNNEKERELCLDEVV
jgi:hypothetical protein